MIQRRLIIRGHVQGVGFRASTLHTAQKYPGLKGFVRNLSDGSVEAVFAGDPQHVLIMAAWCKQGPSQANVIEIEVKEENFDASLPKFRIL